MIKSFILAVTEFDIPPLHTKAYLLVQCTYICQLCLHMCHVRTCAMYLYMCGITYICKLFLHACGVIANVLCTYKFAMY